MKSLKSARILFAQDNTIAEPFFWRVFSGFTEFVDFVRVSAAFPPLYKAT
jgi:hypothetical protein